MNTRVKVLTSMENNKIVDIFEDITTEKEISDYILERHKSEGALSIKCHELSPLGVYKYSLTIYSPDRPVKILQYLVVLYQPTEFN